LSDTITGASVAAPAAHRRRHRAVDSLPRGADRSALSGDRARWRGRWQSCWLGERGALAVEPRPRWSSASTPARARVRRQHDRVV